MDALFSHLLFFSLLCVYMFVYTQIYADYISMQKYYFGD